MKTYKIKFGKIITYKVEDSFFHGWTNNNNKRFGYQYRNERKGLWIIN